MLADIGVYSTQTYYIKRVIGLPGDHVMCCTDGRLTVNGVPLDEKSYLFPGASPSAQPFNVTVPPGRLWVMGDNRAISDDSRGHMFGGFPDNGTVPENEVAGRAFLIIWPLSQFGDLPIPATFQQAALHAGAAGAPVLQVAGAAVSAVATAPVAGTAAVLGIPLLALRRAAGGPLADGMLRGVSGCFGVRPMRRDRGRRRGCAGARKSRWCGRRPPRVKRSSYARLVLNRLRPDARGIA